MDRALSEQYVMGSIALLANGLSRYGDSLLEGMTFRQWFMLRMVSRMPEGEKSIGDIADFAGTTRQNVRKMLGTLERHGYVRIGRSEHDGRALAVALSDQTRSTLAASDEAVSRGLGQLFRGFSDEDLAHLATSLNRLFEVLGEAGGVAASQARTPLPSPGPPNHEGDAG